MYTHIYIICILYIYSRSRLCWGFKQMLDMCMPHTKKTHVKEPDRQIRFLKRHFFLRSVQCIKLKNTRAYGLHVFVWQTIRRATICFWRCIAISYQHIVNNSIYISIYIYIRYIYKLYYVDTAGWIVRYNIIYTVGSV